VVTFGSQSTNYEYDKERLDFITEAGVGTTDYGYEAATGRLSSVSLPFSAGTINLSYRASGRLGTRLDPNNLYHALDYDPAGRLKADLVTRGQGGLQFANFTQAFDPDTHVTDRHVEVADAGDNGDWHYDYDDAGRLITAQKTAGDTYQYTYDGAGNRLTTKKNSDPTVTSVYDEAGRLTSVGGTTYQHDAAGNLTGNGVWTYQYGPLGRMYQASKTGLTLALTYDALDRMTQRQRTGQISITTTLAYRGLSEDLISSVTGPLTKLYGWALGQPAAQKTGADVRYLGLDLHGDQTFVTDSAQALTGWRSFDAWGSVRNTGLADQPSFGFQADVTDPDSGLVDMGARLFSPDLGRFTTVDPFRGQLPEPLSLNRYLFAVADPVTKSDPSGLVPLFCSGPCNSAAEAQSQAKFIKKYSRQATPLFAARSDQAFRYWWGKQPTWLDHYQPRPKNMQAPPVLDRSARLAEREPTFSLPMPEEEKGGGCGFLAMKCAWHVMRFGVTAPITGASVAWAEATSLGDASCGLKPGMVVVCQNTQTWANGPLPALTMGSTVMLEKGRGLDAAALNHETKHADQWGIFGPALPGLYFGNEAIVRGRYLLTGRVDDAFSNTGPAVCSNIFEMWAGLESGDYTLTSGGPCA
jgi:RHS repeat-associated protein